MIRKCLYLTLLLPVLALAARDGGGTYALPTGNPVSSGQTITKDWANNTLADIATALTDSLSRSGKGGMTVPFSVADGSSGGPAFTFTLAPTTGMYRDNGTGQLRFSVAGMERLRIAPGQLGLVNSGAFTAWLKQGGSQVADLTFTLPSAYPAAPYAAVVGTDGTIAPTLLTSAHLSATAGITGAQLASAAGITGSQLSATAGITGSQIAAAAGIAGSQLSAAAGIANTQLATPAIASLDVASWVNATGIFTSFGIIGLTAHGRPVQVMLIPSNLGNSPSYATSSAGHFCTINLVRGQALAGGTSLSTVYYGNGSYAAFNQTPSFHWIDPTPAASGTQYYEIQGRPESSSYSCGLIGYRLVAWEM